MTIDNPFMAPRRAPKPKPRILFHDNEIRAAVKRMTNWQNTQWIRSGMKPASAVFFSKLPYGSGRA